MADNAEYKKEKRRRFSNGSAASDPAPSPVVSPQPVLSQEPLPVVSPQPVLSQEQHEAQLATNRARKRKWRHSRADSAALATKEKDRKRSLGRRRRHSGESVSSMDFDSDAPAAADGGMMSPAAAIRSPFQDDGLARGPREDSGSHFYFDVKFVGLCCVVVLAHLLRSTAAWNFTSDQ